MPHGCESPQTPQRPCGEGSGGANGAMGRRLGRMLQRVAQVVFLYLIRIPIRIVVGAMCHARLIGGERIPLRGAAIVAANHTSLADPVVLQAYLPRRLTFLMTDKFHHIAAVRWFARVWCVVVVKRAGVNRDAMRGAIDALARGEAVGIFPEGGLSRDGKVHDALPGIALLAQRTGVPVVSVGLAGIERLLPPDTWTFGRAPIAMVVGEPVCPQGESRDELADRINAALRVAAAEARRVADAR